MVKETLLARNSYTSSGDEGTFKRERNRRYVGKIPLVLRNVDGAVRAMISGSLLEVHFTTMVEGTVGTVIVF